MDRRRDDPEGRNIAAVTPKLHGHLLWTVTIADDADESHAVYLHDLPFPRKGADPDAVDFRHTRVGKMVRRAKSYSHNTGDAVAATELTDTVMRYWMERHPRYMRADIMIPAAPGNPHKRFDLPLFMATRLAANLGKELVKCSKPQSSPPQKSSGDDLEVLHANIAGKISVGSNLFGKTVIVLDDIYKSGSTIREIVRACRAAGAKEVLSLTATKTAKFCRGITPSEWYEVSMAAAEGSKEARGEP